MDSITQVVLGAAVGQAVLGKQIGFKRAAMLGAIGGTIPDLDVLLSPALTVLQRLSVHRGLSHSLLFDVVGGLGIAWAMKKWSWTRTISMSRAWVFAFLVLFTHALLDAFTTYGTQLFLPFSDYRVSFDSINVVDPVYTLPLIVGLVFCYFGWKKGKEHWLRPNTTALVISSLYLCLTLLNKQRVEARFETLLADVSQTYTELSSFPVGIANLNWYGLAQTSDSLYLAKVSAFGSTETEIHTFPVNEQLLSGFDTYLVDRMRWFAKGHYAVAASKDGVRFYNLQCDMQGVRLCHDYQAPTAFYFSIDSLAEAKYDLSIGNHPKACE